MQVKKKCVQVFSYSIYTISMDAFRLKSLKLLADPSKLKDIRRPTPDKFKQDIECRYNCELNDTLYKHVYQMIADELIIYEVMASIIDQVS